jgi:uncharacterized DUF497 family protein
MYYTGGGGAMARIREPLDWDDENISHLLERHDVLVDEVQEILFGVPGEEPSYLCRREGDHYKIYGETGDGRLLKLRGEFRSDGRFRVFHAMDMDRLEQREYRKRGK